LESYGLAFTSARRSLNDFGIVNPSGSVSLFSCKRSWDIFVVVLCIMLQALNFRYMEHKTPNVRISKHANTSSLSSMPIEYK
jgi:hypothetical protein